MTLNFHYQLRINILLNFVCEFHGLLLLYPNQKLNDGPLHLMCIIRFPYNLFLISSSLLSTVVKYSAHSTPYLTWIIVVFLFLDVPSCYFLSLEYHYDISPCHLGSAFVYLFDYNICNPWTLPSFHIEKESEMKRE